MRTIALALVLAIAAPALSGCLLPIEVEGAIAAHPTVLPDLSDLTGPVFDMTETRLWWESFVNDHPYRHAGTPMNHDASERLRDALEAAGWETEMVYFLPPTGEFSPVDGIGIRTVVGIKPGSVERDRVIAWVSHYDSQRGTIYAAYDDGSGTAAGLALAQSLSTYNNQKTLMAIFFDAEELGLMASDYFVKQVMKDDSLKFNLVIGHDMVGINCPGHKWPMYQMVGENFADILLPIEEELYTKHLGLNVGRGEDSKACVVLLDVHDRNSDERRFKEAGVPIIRMAGGRKATDYPAYHRPDDTVEYVYEFVGGPAKFEQGLELVLRTSWWNVVTFDRLPSIV